MAAAFCRSGDNLGNTASAADVTVELGGRCPLAGRGREGAPLPAAAVAGRAADREREKRNVAMMSKSKTVLERLSLPSMIRAS